MAWLLAFVLVASILATVAGLLWFSRHVDKPHDDSPRPRWYRGRHRSPGPNHPAWLAMDREQVLADDRVIAAMEAMLEEEDHR